MCGHRYAPNLSAALRRYVDEGGLLSLYDGLIPLLIRQASIYISIPISIPVSISMS